METIKRILVISRMNPYSRKTIGVGVSIASKFNARLLVQHIVSNPVNLMALNTSELFPEVQVSEYFNSQQTVRKQLASIIQQEQRQGFPIQELVSERDSVEDILKLVKDEQIDLLLMSAHEEGRIEHALFGGEDDAIIRMMPCSILLVKIEPGRVNW